MVAASIVRGQLDLDLSLMYGSALSVGLAASLASAPSVGSANFAGSARPDFGRWHMLVWLVLS
jgi:hypothetical protein